MKKYLIILLSPLLIVSCKDKPSRNQAFVFKNPTPHFIKIFPFHDGNIILNGVLEVNPNSILVLDTISVPADGDTEPVFHGLFNGFDSVQVHFDNQKLITHLLLPGYTSGNNHYTPDSPRNFNNPNCATIVKPDWVWQITYTFTEQDFIDASQ